MKKLAAYLILSSFIGILVLQLHVHNHQNEHCEIDHQGKSVVHENHIELEACLWCLKNISNTYVHVEHVIKEEFYVNRTYVSIDDSKKACVGRLLPAGRAPPRG